MVVYYFNEAYLYLSLLTILSFPQVSINIPLIHIFYSYSFPEIFSYIRLTMNSVTIYFIRFNSADDTRLFLFLFLREYMTIVAWFARI